MGKRVSHTCFKRLLLAGARGNKLRAVMVQQNKLVMGNNNIGVHINPSNAYLH